MEPGPQIPPHPQQARPLTTALELICWVIAQDVSNGTVIDPVSVPGETLPWIRATMERRKTRMLN